MSDTSELAAQMERMVKINTDMALSLSNAKNGLNGALGVISILAKIIHELAPEWMEDELRKARLMVQMGETGRRETTVPEVWRSQLLILETALGRASPDGGGPT